MPDANGVKTLRDYYPIFCDGCKRKIVDSDYEVTGLYLDDKGIPVSRYGHRACLKRAKGSETTIARSEPAVDIDALMIPHCVYCGQQTLAADFVCDACRQTIKKDLRKTEPSEAIKELLAHLGALRAPVQTLPGYDPEPMREHHTPGANGGNGKSQKKEDKPVRPIFKPSELGKTDEEYGPFVPTNENGVILMVGSIMQDIHYRIVAMPNQYPDAVAISPSKQVINVEFEYASGNFIAHGHDPNACDMVICWIKDRELPIPVLALSQFYDARTGAWDFRQAVENVN